MIELPDVPRWVEAHGIAADPEHWEQALGEGALALGHDAALLIVITGDPDPAAVAQLAARQPAHAILAASEALALSTGRTPQRAILHTLSDPDALPDYEGAVLLGMDDSLPTALGAELAWARERGPVWSCWLDGEPVAFAYAPWRSAKWFDISVDTVTQARQLGLATIVAAAMIRDERSRGREPVWGADEGNAASLRLARRLGFVEADEIWLCPPAGAK